MVIKGKFFSKLLTGLSFTLTALLPFALWYFLRDEHYEIAALVLLAILGIRAIAAWSRGPIGRDVLWTSLLGLGLCLICFVVRGAIGGLFLELYPVVVNASLLLVFGQSLKGERSLVERFASLRVPNDKQDAHFKAYCRKVTIAWCCFFVVNGALALTTVIIGDASLWALYNGFIAYILIGVMFACEYLVRRKVMRA